MPTNPGHIILPSPAGTWKWEEEDERHPAKVWKRPWKHAEAAPWRRPGRTFEVQNTPVATPSGEKHFTPWQVAVMALPEAKEGGYEYIRVRTPGYSHVRGGDAQADVTYKVEELIQKVREHPAFTPKRKGKTMLMDGEGATGQPRWEITPAGLFVPRI